VKKQPADGYEPSAGNRQFKASDRVHGRPTFGKGTRHSWRKNQFRRAIVPCIGVPSI
jgi:hypothetical protein